MSRNSAKSSAQTWGLWYMFSWLGTGMDYGESSRNAPPRPRPPPLKISNGSWLKSNRSRTETNELYRTSTTYRSDRYSVNTKEGLLALSPADGPVSAVPNVPTVRPHCLKGG